MNLVDSCLSIRWMIRRDMPEVYMPEVLDIDFESYVHIGDIWDERSFAKALTKRNCIALTCETATGFRPVGYVLYELHKYKMVVRRMAVKPDWRRRGAGRAILERLQSKLSRERRTAVEIAVNEDNLDAQLFLSRCGYRAERPISGDTQILFRYEV